MNGRPAVVPLASAHVDAVLAIARTGLPAAPGEAALREAVAGTGSRRVWVALSGDRVVGFCSVRLVAPEAEIEDLAIAPSERRNGHGALLLGAVLARLAKDGADRVYLEVGVDNVAALSLYRGAGFSAAGRRPGYYRTGEDAWLFRRDLSGS